MAHNALLVISAVLAFFTDEVYAITSSHGGGACEGEYCWALYVFIALNIVVLPLEGRPIMPIFINSGACFLGLSALLSNFGYYRCLIVLLVVSNYVTNLFLVLIFVIIIDVLNLRLHCLTFMRFSFSILSVLLL